MAASSSTPVLGKDSWLRTVMDKCILKDDGSNFVEWDSTIRGAAQSDNVLTYLTNQPPAEPAARASAALRTAYDEYMKIDNDVKNVLIWSMSPTLKLRFITLNAYEIFARVTTMFSKAPQIRLYEAAVKFFDAKLDKGQKVGPHVLKMIEHIDTLDRQECSIPKKLAVNRILHSLPNKYAHFRVNYNMNNMDKSYHELHSLLVQAERDMEGSEVEKKDVLTMKMKNMHLGVRKGKGSQRSLFKTGKGKGKAIMNSKPKPKAKTSKHPNDTCNHCGEVGHWKRNCPKYLKDKKDGSATPSGAEGRASASQG